MTDEPEQEERDEEWNRNPLPILYPGQDYRDGILYYTAPISREQWTKGTKAKPSTPYVEWGAEVVTTNPDRHFRYEPMTLKDLGFRAYPGFMADDHGWGGEWVEQWTNGHDTTTEPFDIWQRIRNIYTTYIDFGPNEMYYDILTFYVMATYMFKIFESFPYLHFEGTAESGKSQNLRILEVVGFNASLSASMTPADLFRSIGASPGLTLIDEYEVNPNDDKYRDLGELLRFGYKKGGTVKRQRPKPDGTYMRDSFPVYGPKAIASIKPLDPVTRSRVIEITMEPTTRTIPEFHANKAPYRALINDLHHFGLAHAPHVEQVYLRWTPERRQETAPGINNRAWEIAGPIVAMADYVGGDLMTEPLIEWFTNYFEAKKRGNDSQDAYRTLVITLPSVLHNKEAYEGGYYRGNDILSNYFDFSDDDKKKSRIRTRTILAWLAALGFKDTRPGRGGTQVRIEEEQLRHVFRQRGITPRDEDLQWLAGETDYAREATQAEPTAEQLGYFDTDD